MVRSYPTIDVFGMGFCYAGAFFSGALSDTAHKEMVAWAQAEGGFFG